MNTDIPLETLSRFVVATMVGLLIGLERGMKSTKQPHAGTRDFVLFAITGALCALAAQHYQNAWVVVAGLTGILAFLLSGYWADFRMSKGDERGITTELAGFVTFLLGGAAIVTDAALTIAFTVIVLVVLSQKSRIGRFQENVQRFELEAALKLLIITFIVLPFLPSVSLDRYLTLPMGTITRVDLPGRTLSIDPVPGQMFREGQQVRLYGNRGRSLGTIEVIRASPFKIVGNYQDGTFEPIEIGLAVRKEIGVRALTVMASAIDPFRLWVIVVLVSFISFVGYVLIKLLGSAAGIGLTGIVGGLASSTVTALSFARRSVEAPALNRQFAVAIILASTVMFPRLLLQIAVVNQALMQRMALPVMVMAATGCVLAAIYYFRSRESAGKSAALVLDNPFSLASAVKFAAVFATVLMGTQLAIAYLGDEWLPVVSIVSGLSDADAIAFSLSDAQRSGQISTDWAAFNLVLGAISNTFTKLLLIFMLGDRGLFRYTLAAFLIIAGSGLLSAFLYYDLSGMG